MPGITERDPDHAAEPSRWQRLAWFVVLYLVGLAATLIVAYGLKALIPGI